MPEKPLSTAQVARAAGMHPNTIRLYEQWKLLSPVPRDPRNGYRRFSQVHLAQVQVVRAAHYFTWVMGDMRKTGLALLACSASEDWSGACQVALRLLEIVRAERAQAQAAAAYLEQWARGAPDPPAPLLQTTQVARLLETSIDCLRNWERNGLLRVPRDARNGYRRYGPAEIGRLRVIRTLIRSRYSIMAILRMLTRLDQGQKENLGLVLDTPRPDEDVFYAADHWLTTLTELEQHAQDAITLTRQIMERFEPHIVSSH
jgi:DNA-binding transcriptional MerR regulator